MADSIFDKILDKINDDFILYQVQNYTLIRASGRDVEAFLQGQLANDVCQLPSGRGQLNCRLNLKGKSAEFFFIGPA